MKDEIDEEKWDSVMMFFKRIFNHPDILDNFPDKSLLLSISDDEIRLIFTKERLRLIRVIEKKKPKSVKELAKLVNRDITAVDRDLKMLEEAHIIRRERKGVNVVPIIEKKVLIIPIVSLEPKEPEEYLRKAEEETIV